MLAKSSVTLLIDINMNFATWLKLMIRARGMNQAEFCRYVGISKTMFHKYIGKKTRFEEKHQALPQEQTMRNIKKVLGIPEETDLNVYLGKQGWVKGRSRKTFYKNIDNSAII